MYNDICHHYIHTYLQALVLEIWKLLLFTELNYSYCSFRSSCFGLAQLSLLYLISIFLEIVFKFLLSLVSFFGLVKNLNLSSWNIIFICVLSANPLTAYYNLSLNRSFICHIECYFSLLHVAFTLTSTCAEDLKIDFVYRTQLF